MKKATIEEAAWKDVRNEISHVNKTLVTTIDELDPADELTLYKVSYPFGSVVVENGVFHVPLPDGSIVPLNNPQVSKKIRNDFEYSFGGLPAGIVIKNSYELFINSKKYILPILVANPGSIVALWKNLESKIPFHPIRIFSINAGARCIFMLPNISDLALHKNLKRDFNIRLPPPKNLLDQWEIFKTIVYHPNVNCDWSTDLIFFSGKWFDKIKNDKAWQSLLLLFLKNSWDSCAYERNRMLYDFIVSCAQANRNLKPNPYLTDTLKHLIMIGLGTAAGFGIATNNTLAPIDLLQKIYVDCYGLRRYAPIMMHPLHFSLFDKCPSVYYSLSLPTTLEFSPKSRKISSTLHDLSELKHILMVFLDEVRCGRLNIEETVIGQLATHINFDFFHNKHDRHGEIKLTREILQSDSHLAQFSSQQFADSGTFVRGCVRISHKEKFQ